MNEDFSEEFDGQHVCIRELMGDKFEYEDGFYIYRYRTDLLFNKLRSWEDEFTQYRYTDTPFNTAPFKEELIRHYNDFLANYKKRSLDYQGRIGALEARNITDLIWVLENIENGFEVDTYEGDNGFTFLKISIPQRINTVLSRLNAYTKWGQPCWYENLGGTIQSVYERSIFEMYDDPYQEHTVDEILEMAAERYQDCY